MHRGAFILCGISVGGMVSSLVPSSLIGACVWFSVPLLGSICTTECFSCPPSSSLELTELSSPDVENVSDHEPTDCGDLRLLFFRTAREDGLEPVWALPEVCVLEGLP